MTTTNTELNNLQAGDMVICELFARTRDKEKQPTNKVLRQSVVYLVRKRKIERDSSDNKCISYEMSILVSTVPERMPSLLIIESSASLQQYCVEDIFPWMLVGGFRNIDWYRAEAKDISTHVKIIMKKKRSHDEYEFCSKSFEPTYLGEKEKWSFIYD
mgnify:CR=1 FL=1